MAVSAVLLAAGYATRLYPLTKETPKALLPLGEGVILDAVVRALEDVPELARRILVTNARFAPQFASWQQSRKAPVAIVNDGTEAPETRLGAIRDLELARRQGGAVGDLLVLGTDNLFGWSLGEFARKAQARRPDPSIALWEAPSREAATQFGVVSRNAQDRITAFVEKSPSPPSTAVALCVYYFPEPMLGRIQEFIDLGGNTDAPGYFIQHLAKQGTVYGLMMRGAWYDIGSLETYETVQREWPVAGGRG